MALTSAVGPAGGRLRALDEKAAARTWNLILARQGLDDTHRLGTAWQVADAVLGLHAARLPSPFVIVAARTGHPGVPASLFTGAVRETLITIRCMRKTLHALPLPLAAAAHVATLGFRERDARRAVLNAGYTAAAIEPVISWLCALLRDGSLPHRIIEARLAARGTSIRAGRLAIKVAWERGTIAYINATAAWNREARTFALTAAAYPALDTSLTREQAVTELVTAYLDRYGPATIRDAAWWSGLPASDITAALRRCGRPVATVATPWSGDPCLMFADPPPERTGDGAGPTGVQFLAHEDTALKAYFQTRDRYLAGLPQPRAFNQIGEARPCILIDGVVAGTWSWNARTASVETDLIAGRYAPAARRLVKARAAALTDTLRQGWEHRPASRWSVGSRAPVSPAARQNGTAARQPPASVAPSPPR